MIESEIYQFVCFHWRGMTNKMLNLIRALKANSLQVFSINYFLNAMYNNLLWGSPSYIYYTDSVCISVTALYIWMDIYCFLSMKQFFNLTWKSQQLHKENSVIKAHVNDQNVLQLTYLWPCN